jgi:hypothetical protein
MIVEILGYLLLFVATVLQNGAFTLVSRARNSKSLIFHSIASLLSNGIYYIVLRMVTGETPSVVIQGIVYTIGTVTGSVMMHYVSMNFIEKWIEKINLK